jgi:hypothetical protein
MLVPVIKRIKENRNCFVERVFPVDGRWNVNEGDFVEPFNPLGECRFSQNEIRFPEDFKPHNFKNEKKFYYSESLLGKVGKEKVFAPYDGNLVVNEDNSFTYHENERKYVLLSGVWGTVKSLHEKKSALIETQTKDILFSCSVGKHVSGELVVFPNPSDILKKSYLENFVKGVKGKIIYIGDFVGLDVVQKAFEMGTSAIIAGSAHSETIDFAKENKFAVGIFSGFGKIRTPEEIYKFLSSVSYRYVFFEGDKNLLRVPVKGEDLEGVSTIAGEGGEVSSDEIFKEVEPGMKIQSLQEPYFGWVGLVDRVEESSIFVRFGLDDKSIRIRLPNFLIVE